MSLFSRLRAKLASSPPRRAPSRRSRGLGGGASKTRQELVRAALRDTLTRHGIPNSWIESEAYLFSKRGESAESSMHVRLLVRHYEPELLAHGLAFQKSLLKRVQVFDPKAAGWLSGVSWQFVVPGEVATPDSRASSEAPGPAPLRQAPPARPRGPTEEEKLAELMRLFASSDAERAVTHSGFSSSTNFEETRPFDTDEPVR